MRQNILRELASTPLSLAVGLCLASGSLLVVTDSASAAPFLCQNKRTQVVLRRNACKKAEKRILDLASFVGPQGEQGIQGDQGIQGEEGLQGPQGDQGIQGLQGPAGTVDPTACTVETDTTAEANPATATVDCDLADDGDGDNDSAYVLTWSWASDSAGIPVLTDSTMGTVDGAYAESISVTAEDKAGVPADHVVTLTVVCCPKPAEE